MADGEDPPIENGISNARSKQLLGIEYTELSKTMCDMVEHMIASGKVKLST